MSLAAGVSPGLRPPVPRAIGRQRRSRGFSSGCAHPDGIKEASEAEAGVATCEPGAGDGSMVNGEGSGEGGRTATPLTSGEGRARGARVGVGSGGLGPLSDSGRDRHPLAGRSLLLQSSAWHRPKWTPSAEVVGPQRLHLARTGERCGTLREWENTGKRPGMGGQGLDLECQG